MLFYSFEQVKGYLQQHLTEVEKSLILEPTDKTELYSMYINCLEVCMGAYICFEMFHLGFIFACLYAFQSIFVLFLKYTDSLNNHDRIHTYIGIGAYFTKQYILPILFVAGLHV